MEEGRLDECPRSPRNPPQRSAIELVGRPRLKRGTPRPFDQRVHCAVPQSPDDPDTAANVVRAITPSLPDVDTSRRTPSPLWTCPLPGRAGPPDPGPAGAPGPQSRARPSEP